VLELGRPEYARYRDNACAGRPARSKECKSLPVKV